MQTHRVIFSSVEFVVDRHFTTTRTTTIHRRRSSLKKYINLCNNTSSLRHHIIPPYYIVIVVMYQEIRSTILILCIKKNDESFLEAIHNRRFFSLSFLPYIRLFLLFFSISAIIVLITLHLIRIYTCCIMICSIEILFILCF